jgi:hypothetical protein
MGNRGLEPFVDLSRTAFSITNDMAIDARGRAFIGQAGSDLSAGEPLRAAPLIRVDPDGSAHVVGDDLLCANGIVIAEAGRALLVAETYGDRITAFRDRRRRRALRATHMGGASAAACSGWDLPRRRGAALGRVSVRAALRADRGRRSDHGRDRGPRQERDCLHARRRARHHAVPGDLEPPTADSSPSDTDVRTSRIELAEVAVPSAGQP